jgi:hypothetical protein
MSVLQPMACSRQVITPAKITEQSLVASHLAGRIIQFALALYLLPALMVVVAVGCLGMLILAVGRLFSAPIRV